MAVSACGTFLALFVTLCTPGFGSSADKPLKKAPSAVKPLRPGWESSILLDGTPVDRFVVGSRPGRSNRFTKWDRDSRTKLFEDVDPDWVNLDGFAVLSAAPVNSAVPVRPRHRNSSSVHRSARVNRTLHPSASSSSSRTSPSRTLRRAPQSSSGPRQPERYSAGTPLLERRRFHHTKPQSDQRRQRQAPKLTSESVHVVSLQAPKEPGQSAANRGAAAKRPIPDPPPEYEPRDISVRVMSPKSVLISWVDPLVEMGKVEPGTARSYTVRYREKGESARWEYKDSAQRRIMIEDLSADGMYEFSVRINQEHGQGKWSVSVFQRTPESAPSGPPENFEVKPLRGKGTAIIATWDPPEEPNGRIREYILSYAPAMKPFGMKSLTFSGSSSSATVDGLTPGDRYIFKIRATNRRGQGPQSKAFSVAMPTSSRSTSKNMEVRRTTPTPTEYHTEYEESHIQTTLATTTTTTVPTTTTTSTTTTHRAPSNRRVRPLSQTRSYHSIFSSVRGSVRNGHRGTKTKEKTTAPPTVRPTTTTTTTRATTPPPETTTMEVVVETEPNNDVIEEEKPLTTEAPNLKIVTASPTKKAKPPQRRPVKIRVHQKPGSKTSLPSSNTRITTTTAAPHIQESAAKRMDYTATAYPESKNVYNSPVQSKKPILSSQDTHMQPEKESAISNRGMSRGGGGSGGRYGFNRRHPSVFHRGNLTRNGFKPLSGVSSNANVPSRNGQVLLNRLSESSSNEPNKAIPLSNRQETSDGSNSETSTNAKPTSYDRQSSISRNLKPTGNAHSSSNGERHSKSESYESSRHGNRGDSRDAEAESKSNSKAHVPESSPTRTSSSKLDSARSDSRHASKSERNFESENKRIETSSSKTQGEKTTSQSRTHTGAMLLESTRSDNDGNSRQTWKNERNHDSVSKTSQTPSFKGETSVGEETASQSRTDILETAKSDKTENSKRNEDGNSDRENGNKKVQTSRSNSQISEGERTSSLSRTRISPSLLEKYPWLATRYPHRVGTAAKTPNSVSTTRQDARTPVTRATSSASSSVGAGRPISRGTPTRVSGATGAAGVSTIQETSPTSEEDKKTSKLDLLKNNIGSESVKATVTKAVSETRRQPTSTSSSNTNRRQNLEEITDNESHEREYVTEKKDKYDRSNPTTEVRSKESVDATNVGTVLTSGVKTSEVRSKESLEATNIGTVLTSGVSPTIRRPNTGFNGRNRQFGSRFSVRPAQRTESEATSETKPELTSNSSISNSNTPARTSVSVPSSGTAIAGSARDGLRGQGGRSRFPMRGKPQNGGGSKPVGNGKNGRPNLTTAEDKEPSTLDESSKSNGQKYITGPDGTKWLVDLERGLLMNSEGQVLQDSQGKPKRVVVGDDGRTIFDVMGSPLVNQEGVALFGHSRDSRPVVNPKDKMIMVGGKPVMGLDLPKHRTTTTTTSTTTTSTTTTTTTTLAPTTTTEAPTTEWTTPPFPTCPPGTYSKTDAFGYPEVDEEGILDCYPVEEESSGMEDFEKDELIPRTTLPPSTTSTTPSTAPPRPSSRGPSNEFDLSGKKRFTAPYVNYIQKDPGAPCSLTEALEYLQVDVLENLLEKDNLVTQNAPPKNKPHNLTVVAMEGCHSFIILDWARPLDDDMVSGYMVYSASYDDVLNNRWSSRSSSGTHLAVENLKPNSRYYFKVQAKNVFGLGPISETLTYVTESDDPLLIERPPGGEPIWIPFSFKYNSAHSSCKGSQFVKRTWYRKFVGVVLCNSLRYKIFMGDGLREPFYSIGDTLGQGEDHCQFVDSYRDGRTGPTYMSNILPSAQGYYRAYRQEPVTFGVIGRRTNHPFVGWYECGVPIPGKW